MVFKKLHHQRVRLFKKFVGLKNKKDEIVNPLYHLKILSLENVGKVGKVYFLTSLSFWVVNTLFITSNKYACRREIDIIKTVITFLEQRPEVFISVKMKQTRSRHQNSLPHVWDRLLAYHNIRDLTRTLCVEISSVSYDLWYDPSVRCRQTQDNTLNLCTRHVDISHAVGCEPNWMTVCCSGTTWTCLQ